MASSYPLAGYVVLASASNSVFAGTRKNDMLVYTGANQEMYIGSSNAANYVRVTSNMVCVVGDLDVSGILTKNGLPYSTGGGGGGSGFSGATDVGVSGSISCGSLNISANVVPTEAGPSKSVSVYTGTAGAFSGIGSNAGNGLTMDLVGSNSYINMFAWNADGTSGTELLRVTGTGNMGIGTSTPLYPLDVVGTARAGTVLYTSLQQTSDRRLKENVVTTDGSWATSVLERLRVVDYNFIGNTTSPTVGFIAQEVEAVFPLAAKTTSDFVPIGAKSTEVTGDFISSCANVVVMDYGLVLKTYEQFSAGTMLRLVGGHVLVVVEKLDDDGTCTGTGACSSYLISCETITEDCLVVIKEVLTKDFKSLDYNALVACTISAVQSLTKRVKVLEGRLGEVERKSGICL